MHSGTSVLSWIPFHLVVVRLKTQFRVWWFPHCSNQEGMPRTRQRLGLSTRRCFWKWARAHPLFSGRNAAGPEIEPRQRPDIDKETNRSVIDTNFHAVNLIFCLYYGIYVELYFGKDFNANGKQCTLLEVRVTNLGIFYNNICSSKTVVNKSLKQKFECCHVSFVCITVVVLLMISSYKFLLPDPKHVS